MSCLTPLPPSTFAPPFFMQVWGVIFGWTLYAEGAGKTGGQIVGFICGILVIVLGIFLLVLKRRNIVPTLTVLDAVKALALGDLLTQVTALRRARTSPDILKEYQDAVEKCRRTEGCDISALLSLEQLVPVQTSRGTRIKAVLLIQPNGAVAEPVSPGVLIQPPGFFGGEGATEEQQKAAVEAQGTAPKRKVPPALTVNVLLAGGYSLQTEPARGRKYRATASFASVAELLYEAEVPGVPELTEEIGRISRCPTGLAAAQAQLSLYVTGGRDYINAPLTFIPPGSPENERTGRIGLATISGGVRRIYPSLRNLGFVQPPVAATAGEAPLRPRPARERVQSAPAECIVTSLPLAAEEHETGRATATARVRRLSPILEEQAAELG